MNLPRADLKYILIKQIIQWTQIESIQALKCRLPQKLFMQKRAKFLLIFLLIWRRARTFKLTGNLLFTRTAKLYPLFQCILTFLLHPKRLREAISMLLTESKQIFEPKRSLK